MKNAPGKEDNFIWLLIALVAAGCNCIAFFAGILLLVIPEWHGSELSTAGQVKPVWVRL